MRNQMLTKERATFKARARSKRSKQRGGAKPNLVGSADPMSISQARKGTRVLIIMLVMLAISGIVAGWGIEKTIYGPARTHVDGMLSTRPHLLTGPVSIYTPTPFQAR